MYARRTHINHIKKCIVSFRRSPLVAHTISPVVRAGVHSPPTRGGSGARRSFYTAVDPGAGATRPFLGRRRPSNRPRKLGRLSIPCPSFDPSPERHLYTARTSSYTIYLPIYNIAVARRSVEFVPFARSSSPNSVSGRGSPVGAARRARRRTLVRPRGVGDYYNKYNAYVGISLLVQTPSSVAFRLHRHHHTSPAGRTRDILLLLYVVVVVRHTYIHHAAAAVDDTRLEHRPSSSHTHDFNIIYNNNIRVYDDIPLPRPFSTKTKITLVRRHAEIRYGVRPRSRGIISCVYTAR